MAVKSKMKMPDPKPGLKPDEFSIVAVGASAGGLEAFEEFLGNVPDDSGLAYIIIQHLDPNQTGMLPELLQRKTRMDVIQVTESMPVKQNCVYVIPPNTSMSILKGSLHLFKPIETRGLRLPIDFFFRSLAEDCKEYAVAVILSGMGSDGSLGIRAVKDRGGIVLAQDPVSAKYDSMPRNAIDSGLVDIVATAKELPLKLMEFLTQIPEVKENLASVIEDQSALDKIIILLRSYTGNDFSSYKKNTIYRRIERRMSVHKIHAIHSYVDFLQENPKEVEILFKELLIGVTNFFRDQVVWDKLKDTVLPDIFSHMRSGSVIRAWVPGCSTGEEAYSLAIIFKEALDKLTPKATFTLQIFATDLDTVAVEIARRGSFHSNIEADVSASRLKRFFTESDDGYRINSEIREMVVFAQHNIIMHPPFSKVDILTCRNLLIYLDPELQSKLYSLFYYSINPDGILVLGSSETLGSQSNLFSTIDAKLKIFKRSNSIPVSQLKNLPSALGRSKSEVFEKLMPVRPTQNIEALADQMMLQSFSPAGVLVNENGDIIYFSGHTGKYLEPAVGKANLNIFAMLREGLRSDFPNAFRQAIMNKKKVVLSDVRVINSGVVQHINISIQWIDKPEPLMGKVMVIFHDIQEIAVPNKKATKGMVTVTHSRQAELEDELQHSREEMQTMLEEMQTSQEELKSTNEELQSANEELQSTNEELTSSREEMQSLNEELQVVNAELQSKLDDFTRVNNDMKNLLNSTDIATLFLDKDLKIRRYTDRLTKIFKLIKSDIGRPFTDQVSDLVYPDLAADAREVLRTLLFQEKQVPTRDGRWFTIRIMPYRTFDDRIDGLVITFIDITVIKAFEDKLQITEQIYRLLAHGTSDLIIRLSNDWTILEVNPEVEKAFGRSQSTVSGKNFFIEFVPETVRKKTARDMNKLLSQTPESKIKIQVLTSGDEVRIVEWTVNIIYNNLNSATGVIIISKNNQTHEQNRI